MASLPPLRTKVGADVGAFTGGINAAVASLGGFKGAIGTAGVALAAFAGAKGIGAAVSAFSEFDEKMTESQAIMGDLSQKTMAQMESAALSVSRTTLKSANEAAESYFFLASAGLDAEQSIAALPQVAQFAQAGMFDMATATDLATDAQSALGLTVDDAAQNLRNLTRVTDVFVRANQLANATVEQFSEAVTNKLGARLRLLNKDLEEGTAALAALADQGVKGRRAGRGLNIVFRDLSSQAVKSERAFQQLGIRVFDTEGNMRNLADILEDFEALLGDATAKEQAMAFETLGLNRRAQDFLGVLIGMSDEVREYEGSLRDAQGATEEVSEKQVQTLSRQMELLGSEFATATIKLGGFISEGLNLAENAALIRAGIQNLREGMQGFSDDVADAFGEETADRLETTLEGMEFRFGIDKDAVQEQVAGLADALPDDVRNVFASQVESALEDVEEGRIAAKDLNRVIAERARLLARNAAIRRRAGESQEEEVERETAREKELRRQREDAAQMQQDLADARRRVVAQELGLTTVLLDKERERLRLMIEQGAEAEERAKQAERVAKLERELGEKSIEVEPPSERFMGEDVLEPTIQPPELEDPGLPEPPEVKPPDIVDPSLLGEDGAFGDLSTVLQEAAIPALDRFAGELGIGSSILADFLDSLLTSIGKEFGDAGGAGGFLASLAGGFAGGFQGGGRIPAGKVGLVHAGEALAQGPARVTPNGQAASINLNVNIDAVDSRGIKRVVESGEFKRAAVEAGLQAASMSEDFSRSMIQGGGMP